MRNWLVLSDWTSWTMTKRRCRFFGSTMYSVRFLNHRHSMNLVKKMVIFFGSIVGLVFLLCSYQALGSWPGKVSTFLRGGGWVDSKIASCIGRPSIGEWRSEAYSTVRVRAGGETSWHEGILLEWWHHAVAVAWPRRGPPHKWYVALAHREFAVWFVSFDSGERWPVLSMHCLLVMFFFSLES